MTLKRVLTGAVIVSGALLLVPALVPALQAQAAGRERWVAPERRARRPNPTPADAASVQRGRTVYRQECQKCHGATGNNDGSDAGDADMAQARRLSDPTLWDESDGALFWKISQGRDPMPSTLDVLTDAQRWDVVNYIRTFAPRPAGRGGSGGTR